MEDFRARRYIPVLSDLLGAELRGAPPYVRDLYAELISLGGEMVVPDDAARQLLGAYKSRFVLGTRYENDMMHIALATATDADILVSWNFKHIVRYDKVRRFNAVNLEPGYKALAIHSPQEVATHGAEGIQGG